MTPVPAPKTLDAFFLEIRCKILDVAAILDRLGRGEGSVQGDPRMERVRQALETLLQKEGNRAERVQQLFSLEYDANWKRPQPK